MAPGRRWGFSSAVSSGGAGRLAGCVETHMSTRLDRLVCSGPPCCSCRITHAGYRQEQQGQQRGQQAAQAGGCGVVWNWIDGDRGESPPSFLSASRGGPAGGREGGGARRCSRLYRGLRVWAVHYPMLEDKHATQIRAPLLGLAAVALGVGQLHHCQVCGGQCSWRS